MPMAANGDIPERGEACTAGCADHLVYGNGPALHSVPAGNDCG